MADEGTLYRLNDPDAPQPMKGDLVLTKAASQDRRAVEAAVAMARRRGRRVFVPAGSLEK